MCSVSYWHSLAQHYKQMWLHTATVVSFLTLLRRYAICLAFKVQQFLRPFFALKIAAQ